MIHSYTPHRALNVSLWTVPSYGDGLWYPANAHPNPSVLNPFGRIAWFAHMQRRKLRALRCTLTPSSSTWSAETRKTTCMPALSAVGGPLILQQNATDPSLTILSYV